MIPYSDDLMLAYLRSLRTFHRNFSVNPTVIFYIISIKKSTPFFWRKWRKRSQHVRIARKCSRKKITAKMCQTGSVWFATQSLVSWSKCRRSFTTSLGLSFRFLIRWWSVFIIYPYLKLNFFQYSKNSSIGTEMHLQKFLIGDVKISNAEL